MRKSHFTVEQVRRFNGYNEATVTILGSHNGLVVVRPKHCRETYDVPLADVAAWVIDRAARIKAAEGTKS